MVLLAQQTTGTIECAQGSLPPPLRRPSKSAAYKLVMFVFYLTLLSVYEKEAPTTLIDRLAVDL